MEAWRIVAHNHWFTLKLFNRELRICSRCSGYLAGFSVFFLSQNLLRSLFLGLEVEIQLMICFLTVIPMSTDWLTQSWGFRESNNQLRFATGAILGIGMILFYASTVVPSVKIFSSLIAASAIVFLGLFGKSVVRRKNTQSI